MRRPALLPLALLALLALPARAGLLDDDEARARIERLRADMRGEFEAFAARVERASKNQMDFANQVEALKADLAKLRGQLEVFANDIEATQKRQRDFYVDLDSRLRKLEAAATTPAPAAEAAPEAPPAAKADPAQETRDYEAALAAIKAGRYKDALAAFQGFIKNHPNSGLLPNAHYWLASSHYQLGDYARAGEGFARVAATWPNDAKAPDALLAQASALTEAGDAKNARKVLETLVARYPAANAAQTAKLRLKKK
jgi:tol-pal system protein YbgF